MKMQFKTICQRHYNRTHTHSHCRRKCENENNNEREKENELWSMRTANCELATLQRKSVLPRSARVVAVCTWGASKWHKNDCVCVWVWVGVLSFGTRHAYNKPQMCRLSGQKCMQHISQFERGQRTKQTQGTLSCCGCATSTPTLNAWQLHQAVSYPSSPFCHSEILTYVRLGP